MKSIIQDEKECFVCAHKLIQAPERDNRGFYVLECHHVFAGTANRKMSEKYGLKVWLCHEHHTGDTGVHFNETLNELLKEIAQRRFEEYYKGVYNRSDFIRFFGKNHL
jgi:hypothetical protein